MKRKEIVMKKELKKGKNKRKILKIKKEKKRKKSLKIVKQTGNLENYYTIVI